MNDAYNLRKIFEEMELYLVKSLKRNLRRHEKEEEEEGFKWEMWQKAKLRNLKEFRQQNKEIIDDVKPEVSKIVNETIDRQYQKGQIQFPKSLSHRKPDTPAPQEKNFFHVNDGKMKAMKQVVNSDLRKGQHAALRKMDDVYRKVVYNASVNMTAGVMTLDQAIDKATQEFLNQGINCIEYKDGKRVNIASYAEMSLRTASHRAMLLGEGKKRDEWGIHTVVVSAHANTCPHCERWQGTVLVDDVFSSGTIEEALEGKYYLLSFAIESGLLH